MNGPSLVPSHRLIVLAVIGCALAVRPWMPTSKSSATNDSEQFDFVVTSSEDAGEGSLREVIFRANRAAGRARVTITADRVVLNGPLPPLSNPDGVELIAGHDSIVIRGTNFGARPMFDIVAPASLIEGLIIDGPSSICIRSAARIVLRRTEVRNCSVGVLVAGRSDGSEITENRFVLNQTGLRIEGSSSAVRVLDNRFLAHSETAIWVGGEIADNARPIEIAGNTFDDDRISVLIAGRGTVVRDNIIRTAQEAGIYVGGTDVEVLDNQVNSGGRVGILAEDAQSMTVDHNRVDGNSGVGILVRSGAGNRITQNETHRNGYGILLLFGDSRDPNLASGNVASANRLDGIAVVGSSPVLRANVSSGNRQAGLRIQDWHGASGLVVSDPLLDMNRISNNGEDRPPRSRFRGS